MQKYSLNNDYFSVIDNEHKAYWLGFLYADGSLSKTAPKCSGYNRIQIFLSNKDKCILENFKKDLKYNGPIHEAQYNNSFREGTKAVCYMHINSRKMCMDLESLGYTSNRTSMPSILPQFEKHFIRGYFDGDGCISVYDSKQPSHNKKKYYDVQRAEFSITTQEEILIQFRDIFERECNVSKGIKFKKYKRTSKAVSLRYGGRQQIISLYHYLYDDATIYLQRKYDNFQKVLNK